jgi:hypothetical protein
MALLYLSNKEQEAFQEFVALMDVVETIIDAYIFFLSR